MIPPFNDSGFLPMGVHPATLAEIAERFGGPSELRRVQMDSVRWMIELARRSPANCFERQFRDRYNGTE